MQLKSLFSDLLAANEHRISAIFWSQEDPSTNARWEGFHRMFHVGSAPEKPQNPQNGQPQMGNQWVFLENGEGLEIEIYIYIFIYMLTRDWIM